MKNQDKIKKKAYQLLIKQKCSSFPIRSLQMAADLHYHLETYTEAEKQYGDGGVTRRWMYHCFGNAFVVNICGIYNIFYNEYAGLFNVNWTIMHEIAHIRLGHVKWDGQFIGESYVDKFKYSEKEQAAEYFTSIALCPDTVLDAMHRIDNVEHTALICYVPRDKAKQKVDYFADTAETRMMFSSKNSRSENRLLSQYSDFINTYGKRVEIAEEIYIDFSRLSKVGA
ncbi:ImmA/IrrE family metallo-endopeptidase [Qiania dongpingensis]|uniref:ImmA/IrrE family metallo-endopeptidase n=1 Tax=Qiania dongpingensis TaxID=2763669 RepID=A0A7G9G720_9FIRM|nr:ImmA/IrrE family metallo-endopeptidase [Qiania dongpingensis]QNM06602.1 ImmA/IrrE family metallo-endopeptidase [Qiania dongpingensis]